MFACQDPASIRKAYDIPASADGAGRTIVIIDAFGSPTLQSDLDRFSDTFGLPRTTVQVVYPGGKPAWSGTSNQEGWAEETSLDVQWAHSIAPKATIKLVVAATNYGSALATAQSYVAANDLGDVVSMSYGIPEAALTGNSGQTTQSAAGLQGMAAKGMTVFASSGDAGSDNGYGFSNFAEPASNPNVTAVGGTNLWYGTNVSKERETVWGDYDSSNCPTCVYGPNGPAGATAHRPTTNAGSWPTTPPEARREHPSITRKVEEPPSRRSAAASPSATTPRTAPRPAPPVEPHRRPPRPTLPGVAWSSWPEVEPGRCAR